MRVLYAMRSVGHFSYHETVIRHLCKNGDSVEVLFDRGWSQGCSNMAAQACLADTPGLKLGWLSPRRDRWRRPLFAARELLSYSSYLNRKDQSEFYLKRWERYLSPPIQKIVRRSEVARSFVAGKLMECALRTFGQLAPPAAEIIQRLKRHRPDVVVASPTNMRFSEEAEYIRAAKALGIPTVVSILSWDNLTTKGLCHIVPDLTLVWNRTQLKEATRIHRIPADQIVVTGSPFFDKWFETQPLKMERGSFCRKVGLDPAKPFLVYLGSSANIARDEGWLVQSLSLSLREHTNSDVREMNILVRPHPANARIYAQLEDKRVTVWPREGALPDTEDSTQDFYNTLQYSVAAVGINTSGMIDAVLNNKPCVTLMTDRYRTTQLQAVHFRQLLGADVLEIVKNARECAGVIETLWAGRDSKQQTRQRFVRDFVRPRGLQRPSGEVAAQAIKLAALGKSAAQIDSNIG
jgi:hypothetical protein